MEPCRGTPALQKLFFGTRRFGVEGSVVVGVFVNAQMKQEDEGWLSVGLGHTASVSSCSLFRLAIETRLRFGLAGFSRGNQGEPSGSGSGG
jgi:hypothetical protein